MNLLKPLPYPSLTKVAANILSHQLLLFLAGLILFAACQKPVQGPDNPDEGKTEEPVPEPVPEPTGQEYVWDSSQMPVITINMSVEEWNKLLKRFDEYDHNADYFHADVTFEKAGEKTVVNDAGVRLRGNTSRRRPEGNRGQLHDSENPDWHHCHFGINLRKFRKDDEHTIKGVRKFNLKWFKDDPMYVRELYCYDLFRRYGIWTAPLDVYCRVYVKIGEEKAAYFGVYGLTESVDEKYLKNRKDEGFGNDKGYLWKCGWGDGPADLDGLDGSWGVDKNTGVNYTYEFKGEEAEYAAAKAQFEDFLKKLQGKGDESFKLWIEQVCDVEFLLKTYAVNVATGMWDDMWNGGNNYYIYFNSTDLYNYKFYFIPYDYDNTLGTGNGYDPGRQDPYKWGDRGLLMKRLMKFPEYRAIYRDALKELADEGKGLFHHDASVARIRAWHEMISPYISNDTGEDMKIEDRPAPWGNHGNYRILSGGEDNNFFKVKTSTIKAMK